MLFCQSSQREESYALQFQPSFILFYVFEHDIFSKLPPFQLFSFTCCYSALPMNRLCQNCLYQLVSKYNPLRQPIMQDHSDKEKIIMKQMLSFLEDSQFPKNYSSFFGNSGSISVFPPVKSEHASLLQSLGLERTYYKKKNL